MNQDFVVSVPASSGNLGPGFDVLGLALSLRNDLYVRVLPNGEPTSILIQGEGAESISRKKDNLIYKCLSYIFKKVGSSIPSLDLFCVNRIPLARGLGSSSAAILTGLLAGNHLLRDPFSPDEILNFATEIEGHPDNVASALFGGVQASAVRDGQVLRSAWPAPKTKLIVAVPNFELSTKKSRAVVPKSLLMADAISNLSSVALMPEAFSKKPQWLKFILNDRWHEPYRAKLVRGFSQVKAAALGAGAYGVTLSGAGPTVLSFVPVAKMQAISKAMERAFQKSRVKPKMMKLDLDKKGAIIQ